MTALNMPKVHTHYDNLKVARNAPPEIIRAAYKTLSQKFHPDRNAGDESATRVFQIISAAYEVLSDPVKRKEHDEWIAKAEALEKPSHEASASHETFHSRSDIESQNFTGQIAKHYGSNANTFALALKGLSSKQRNFVFMLSGFIIALVVFIILLD